MSSETGIEFSRPVQIRFSHCDPAGIVFFPQYLVLFNQLVEDWFDEGLGIGYADMIGRRQIGLPIVRLECDFQAISRMGDEVTLCLSVERIGGKSLTLQLQCRDAGQVRVSARKVLVFTDLKSHRAIPMPADIRQALEGVTVSPQGEAV
ncbi:MAG: thioesterase family protein [Lautropia sp.]|nr:thioesterase family protein [Lautropia sp.]